MGPQGSYDAVMRLQPETPSNAPREPQACMVPPFHVSGSTLHAPRSTPLSSAFTLIELILVMAILTMAVAVTAPVLSHFFRGRALDSEARRLLALARSGQSRAVSEGIPVDLWVNAEQGTYGVQLEPSYEPSDPKAVELNLDSGLQIEVVTRAAAAPVKTVSSGRLASTASVPRVALAHPSLPTIRFLPDGSISESSPEKLRLSGREGASLWLAQSSDHLAYEIRNTDN
jgi:prepilin-type N-terminal cleavage/methylation domain-containing protein